jgi:hypothetical protein
MMMPLGIKCSRFHTIDDDQRVAGTLLRPESRTPWDISIKPISQLLPSPTGFPTTTTLRPAVAVLFVM